jgi:hypothetical protein
LSVIHRTYPSSNIIRVIKQRRMRLARYVAVMVEIKNVHKTFLGKPKGKRPLGRPRRRGEEDM